jgi:integrase
VITALIGGRDIKEPTASPGLAAVTPVPPVAKHRRRVRGNGSVYPVSGHRHGWRGSIVVRDEDGQRKRRYVTGMTSAEVVAKLATAQDDATAAAARAASPTVEWWVNRWLGTIRLRVRPSSLDGYRYAIGKVVPLIGDRPLIDLRPADIEAMLARLVDGGMARSTAALVRNVLVIALGDAVRDGRITRNVASAARAPRVEPVERRRLNPTEVRRVLAAAAEDPNTDALVTLALGAGARIGELCALDWTDVDLAAATVTIRGTLGRRGVVGPPKSRQGRRVVALPGFAVAALRRELERRPGVGPVLTGVRGGRLTGQRAGDRWRDLRARLGFDDVRFHDLRGTAATLALSAGVPPTEVARSLGHDPAVLMRLYAGAIPGGRNMVADAIDRALR